eukprot:scaffold219050_cov28-Tisochrysis_lutea.AAC.1
MFAGWWCSQMFTKKVTRTSPPAATLLEARKAPRAEAMAGSCGSAPPVAPCSTAVMGVPSGCDALA